MDLKSRPYSCELNLERELKVVHYDLNIVVLVTYISAVTCNSLG